MSASLDADEKQYQVTCRNDPITDPAERSRFDALRHLLAAAAFRTGVAPPVQLPSLGESLLLSPSQAYAVCFLRTLDARIEALLQRAFDDERRAIWAGRRLPPPSKDEPPLVARSRFDPPGVIYVFRDSSLRDRLVVKIGRTSRTARSRLVEWERELAPQEGEQLQLLFAVPARYHEFAEETIHRTLECERLDKFINRRSGRKLREFFRVEQFMALKLFVLLSVAYTDQFGALQRRAFADSPLGVRLISQLASYDDAFAQE